MSNRLRRRMLTTPKHNVAVMSEDMCIIKVWATTLYIKDDSTLEYKVITGIVTAA